MKSQMSGLRFSVGLGALWLALGCGASSGGPDDVGPAAGGAKTSNGSGGKANGGQGGGARSGGAPGAGGETSDDGGSRNTGGGTSAGGRRGSGGSTQGDGGTGSDGGSDAVGGRAAGGSAAGGGAACDTSAIAEGQQTVSVEGAGRSYYLIPSTTPGPVPLVISFHGYGGNGEADVWTFGLRDATGGKAVLMYPNGVPQDWYSGAVGWDTRSNTSPDIQFVKAMIEDAKAKHCIDVSRIYVVGFSWGGWMASQTACALGSEIRAFVSFAGGGPMTSCNGPVSAMIAHGTNDGSENISAGEATRDTFASINGCEETTSPALDGNCVAYDGCERATVWCEHAGGHEVPAGPGQQVWPFLLAAP